MKLTLLMALFLIIAMLGSEVQARSKNNVPAYLKDLELFANSNDPSMDRDGDGRADFWQTFHPNGRLRLIKTSTLKDGTPNQMFHFNERGVLYKKELDENSDGTRDVVIIYRDDQAPNPGDVAELTEYYSPQGMLTKKEILKRSEGHDPELRTIYYSADGITIAREELRMVEKKDTSTGATPECLPGGPVFALPAVEVESLMNSIGGKIQVAASCDQLQVNRNSGPITSGGTGYGSARLKTTIEQTIRDGVTCLNGLPGGSGKVLADQLLVNVFKNASNPLKITCDTPDITDNVCGTRTANACGLATRFTETASNPTYPGKVFPAVSFGSNCGRDDMRPMIFHELLHLTGCPSRQHLHGSGAETNEVVEPCAQCCLASDPNAIALRDEYCNLCKNRPASDPVQHNLAYAKIAFKMQDYALAVENYEKVMAVMPDEPKAERHKLLMEMYRAYGYMTASMRGGAKSMYIHRMAFVERELCKLSPVCSTLKVYGKKSFLQTMHRPFADNGPVIDKLMIQTFCKTLTSLDSDPSKLKTVSTGSAFVSDCTQFGRGQQSSSAFTPKGVEGFFLQREVGAFSDTKMGDQYYQAFLASAKWQTIRGPCERMLATLPENPTPADQRAKTCYDRAISYTNSTITQMDKLKTMGEQALAADPNALSKNEKALVDRADKFKREAEFYKLAIERCMSANPSLPNGHPTCKQRINYPPDPAPTAPKCP